MKCRILVPVIGSTETHSNCRLANVPVNLPAVKKLASLRYHGKMLFGDPRAEMKGSGENPRDVMGFEDCKLFLQETIYIQPCLSIRNTWGEGRVAWISFFLFFFQSVPPTLPTFSFSQVCKMQTELKITELKITEVAQGKDKK